MQRRRPKSHKVRNAAIAIIVLMFVVGLVVGAFELKGPPTDPNYSDIFYNDNSAIANNGTLCNFAVLWQDPANLSGYIFGCNNTGTFVNNTWTPFFDLTSVTQGYARAQLTLNDTPDDFVSWMVWANDSGNRWNETAMQSTLIVSPVLLTVSGGAISGDITIQPFSDMPITSFNFINLTASHLYDNTTFSRVSYGFVIQGGDTTPNGVTVPTIPDELPNKHSNVLDSVAMAKTTMPNSATSQFFINLNNNTAALDSDYSVFGNVTSGMNIVNQIGQVPINPTDPTTSTTDGSPVTPIYIISASFTNP